MDKLQIHRPRDTQGLLNNLNQRAHCPLHDTVSM